MPSDLAHSLSALLGVKPWDVEEEVERMAARQLPLRETVLKLQGVIWAEREVTRQWRGRAEAAERRLEEIRAMGWDRDWNRERAREIAPTNNRYRRAVRAALHRGKTWSLGEEEYLALAEQPCVDCGEPTGTGIGLDRLDESRGYEMGNVAPCCPPCNMARHRNRVPKNVAEGGG